MDREQAKLLGFSKEARKTEYSGNYIHLDNVIDIVYDDFESRVCENCKYLSSLGFCINNNSIGYGKDIYEDSNNDDPVCNKHEPKET